MSSDLSLTGLPVFAGWELLTAAEDDSKMFLKF